MSSPDRPEPWERELEKMIGGDERCIVCGGWVPPAPSDKWIIIIGPNYFGVAHNDEHEPCVMRLNDAQWELKIASYRK